MPVGVSLSQLIAESPEPLVSGIELLDEALGGGFQPRSIYEIYGPPGTGKTQLGISLVERSQGPTLWIETFQTLPTSLLSPKAKQHCFRTRCTKFTQLLYLWQTLSEPYPLVIIDGLSQLLCDHMNHLEQRSSGLNNLHDTKCKHLATLFTAITKYAHQTSSTVLLLNHCMNTSHLNGALAPFEQDLDVVDDGSYFLVTSTAKRNVQVLRSALVASGVAMGPRDSRWECFLTRRIALFWQWDPSSSARNKPNKSRIAILTTPARRDAVQVPCKVQQTLHVMQDDVVWDSEG